MLASPLVTVEVTASVKLHVKVAVTCVSSLFWSVNVPDLNDSLSPSVVLPAVTVILTFTFEPVYTLWPDFKSKIIFDTELSENAIKDMKKIIERNFIYFIFLFNFMKYIGKEYSKYIL